jgi:sugar lactone lactonase YvrE
MRVRSAAVFGLIGVATLAYANTRPFGDAVVLTQVTSPGFPENGAVDGNAIYVGTPGTPNPTSTLGASRLRKYDLATGALLNEWVITGEDLTRPHGLYGIALDSAGRVYAAEQQGKIHRIDPTTGVQDTYASLPNLPTCSSVASGTPCSTTAIDLGAFPDDLVFAGNGDMYVTDIFQATIWKVPAGGGAPQIWYQDARFDGASGVNGIRFNPPRTQLYLTLSAPLPSVLDSGVYSLPAVASPAASDLHLIHAYSPGPDGLAVGASGTLYVALPFLNAVAVVDPSTGAELHRIVGPAKSGLLLVPFDTPTSVTFSGNGSFIMTNNSVSGNPLTTALFDVFANDNGDALERPAIP